MKLSNQAMGALMLALQKSILEQTDIVPILQGFDFRVQEDNSLEIENPPVFKIDKDIFPTKGEKVNTVGSD